MQILIYVYIEKTRTPIYKLRDIILFWGLKRSKVGRYAPKLLTIKM